MKFASWKEKVGEITELKKWVPNIRLSQQGTTLRKLDPFPSSGRDQPRGLVVRASGY